MNLCHLTLTKTELTAEDLGGSSRVVARPNKREDIDYPGINNASVYLAPQGEEGLLTASSISSRITAASPKTHLSDILRDDVDERDELTPMRTSGPAGSVVSGKTDATVESNVPETAAKKPETAAKTPETASMKPETAAKTPENPSVAPVRWDGVLEIPTDEWSSYEPGVDLEFRDSTSGNLTVPENDDDDDAGNAEAEGREGGEAEIGAKTELSGENLLAEDEGTALSDESIRTTVGNLLLLTISAVAALLVLV